MTEKPLLARTIRSKSSQQESWQELDAVNSRGTCVVRLEFVSAWWQMRDSTVTQIRKVPSAAEPRRGFRCRCDAVEEHFSVINFSPPFRLQLRPRDGSSLPLRFRGRSCTIAPIGRHAPTEFHATTNDMTADEIVSSHHGSQ